MLLSRIIFMYQCIYSLISCTFHLTCVGAEVDDAGGQIVTFWREFRQLRLLCSWTMTLLQVFRNVNCWPNVQVRSCQLRTLNLPICHNILGGDSPSLYAGKKLHSISPCYSRYKFHLLSYRSSSSSVNNKTILHHNREYLFCSLTHSISSGSCSSSSNNTHMQIYAENFPDKTVIKPTYAYEHDYMFLTRDALHLLSLSQYYKR